MEEGLKEFGLTENEIKIYLALLKLGTSSPSKISKETGLSRSYVYDALERLIEKQMASSILKNNKKHFTATNPKMLEEVERQKLNKIQKIIPHLENLQKTSKEEIKVGLHKGAYVYKILLRDIVSSLKNKDEVFIFGIDDDTLVRLDPYYPTYLDIYFDALGKKNIKEKVIVKRGAKVINEAKNTQYRYLPKESFGNTAFEVYGDKVAIFLLGNPNYLILIENKEVADSYRNQFKILWESASPRKFGI